MPKSQNHSKKDRAQDDSKPYQRQQAHTTRNVDSQPKQQQRNSSTSQTESVTSAILASISQPPATRPKKTSSGANRPSLLVNNRGRQAEHIQVGPSPDIVHEQLFTTEGADATTVQVKHAEFWRTCLPSEPSIYSSLLVDIGNANDKQITADGSTSASNPIRYRTLCFLTKKTVPIESTDTLPIFNPPLAYPSAPRYTFNCRAGPSIDLTNPADHSRVRHYTIKMMQIMAKDPKFMLSEADMPYLIVPVSHSHTADLDQSPGDSIAWEEVHAFAAADGRMLERDEVADEIRLKAIVDDGLLGYYHTDGSARFQILGLCHDLCPSSKLVSDGGSEYSIISIQPKRWKETLASRGEELWEDQPVFEVETAYDLHQMARPASSLRSHCRCKSIRHPSTPSSSQR
ncbi:hypothetical protein QFC19_005483 [Naganishia cerealis]|uniref:Uncharacterized protein n=1 Tax=Naganishia cerealis TaxID=610337 RepID=A0ACC2VNN4_9TREE|nr:hypothetical protein QFC19_005483 [Naganishia cerealis]